MSDESFIPADEEHIRRERAAAQEMRRSAWWKNQRGNGKCYYCKRRVDPKRLTMDHIVPVIRGGKTTRSNVVPCCKDCNTDKKNMLPVEWAAHQERLGRDGDE